ncbi:hypothetical protein Taro_010029, partial [Colocasia esculenta]|nr:hypothetical protein [Colocasia esculenta]
ASSRSKPSTAALMKEQAWMTKSADSKRSRPIRSGIGLWQPDLGGTPTHPRYKVKSRVDRSESGGVGPTPADPPRLHSLLAASTGNGAMSNGVGPTAARASRRSYAEEDDRRRGLGTSGSHLSRDDSRGSLPRSTSVRRAVGALGCGGRPSDVHTPTQGPMDQGSPHRGIGTNRVERYRMKLGIYGGYDMRCAAQRLTPAERWIHVNYQQAGTNPLTYVAVRVLSQTTSSSQC